MKTRGSKEKKTKKASAKVKAGASKASAKAKAVAKKAAAPKALAKAKTATKSPLKAKASAKAKAVASKKEAPKKAPAPPRETKPKGKETAPKPAVAAKPAAPPAPAPAVEVVSPAAASSPPRPKAVVRIAGGRSRGPERPATSGAVNGTGLGTNGVHRPQPVEAAPASATGALGARFEVNPKMESTRGKIKTPPPAAMVAQSVKGMTVAEKRRAEAEAMFKQYSKPGFSAPASAPASSASNGPAAPSGGTDEYGRFSHRDSLMTMLRMAAHRSQALEAATELANRYQLPADQTLLLKVIDLGEARLTKLALEELLELDDRGRVRPNDQLRASLAAVEAQDPETRELKDLLLAKVGVRV